MTFDFNPNSDHFVADPYASYKQLRAMEEPYYCPQLKMWLVSRYAQINSVATHPDMVRSLEAFLPPKKITERRREMNWHDMPYHQRYIQVNLLESDGDKHRRLRGLVFAEFTARAVERHKAMISDYIEKLLHPLIESGEFDFMDEFAVHIPGHIIGQVIGVPASDCPSLREWSENIVQFFNIHRTQKHKDLAEEATKQFADYLTTLIRYREKSPKDDLLSKLIIYKNAGQMDETELVATAMLILMAGHGSTIDVLGSGMHCLLKYPEQMALLRSNPNLMTSAVQEMFRFETPLPFFHRYASRDIEIMGRHYKQGEQFGILYASANRDPEVFSHADEFNITRAPNRHLSFGKGAHLCLGNHLSRIDMDMVFSALLRRTKTIELSDSTITYKKGLSVRGPKALPIKVTGI